MAIYSASIGLIDFTSGNPVAEISAGPSNSPRLVELGAQTGATTNNHLMSVGVSPVPGIGLAKINLLAEELGGPSQSQTTISVTWSRAPTLPTIALRRLQMRVSAIGQYILLTFPRGYAIPQSGSIVVWNTAAGNAGSVLWCATDE